MLQEEALKIKESLKDSWLDSFADCNGWLEKCEAAYGIWQTGEANDVSIFTVKSWTERIPELGRSYLGDFFRMSQNVKLKILNFTFFDIISTILVFTGQNFSIWRIFMGKICQNWFWSNSGWNIPKL